MYPSLASLQLLPTKTEVRSHYKKGGGSRNAARDVAAQVEGAVRKAGCVRRAGVRGGEPAQDRVCQRGDHMGRVQPDPVRRRLCT